MFPLSLDMNLLGDVRKMMMLKNCGNLNNGSC